MHAHPDIIETVEQLDEVITRPSDALVEFVAGLSGRLVVLGAGGKMGPSLCIQSARAVRMASADLEVVAVSRFSDENARRQLEDEGVRTIACDLMDADQVAELPDADNVVFLVGWKFGTAESPGRTWAINTVVPSIAANRYRDARIVALSSGNVYPFVSPESGGASESTAPSPIGEYAWSCLGRERVFQHWSDVQGTRMALIRLNYAVDLRYGVLIDLASKIKSGRPVDLATGFLNCIWQAEANDMIVRSLSLAESPAVAVNLTGSGTLQVRDLAQRLSEYMGMPVSFSGTEAKTALLNDSSALHDRLGPPEVSIDRVLKWTAHWVMNDMPLIGKPTHFDVRDGRF